MPSGRILGSIKWFGNMRTGGQYGFVSSASGVDYFLPGNQVIGFAANPDTVVLFDSKPSRRHPDKCEAFNVTPLSKIDDPEMILDLAFSRDDVKVRDVSFRALARRFGDIAKASDWGDTDILNVFLRLGLIADRDAGNLVGNSVEAVISFLSLGIDHERQEGCMSLLLGELQDKEVIALYFNGSIPYSRFVLSALLKEWPELSEKQRITIVADARPDAWHFLEQYSRIVLSSHNVDTKLLTTTHIANLLEQIDWRRSVEASSGLPDGFLEVLGKLPVEERAAAYLRDALPFDKGLLIHLVRQWKGLSAPQRDRIDRDAASAGVSVLDSIITQLLQPLARVNAYEALDYLKTLLDMYPSRASELIESLRGPDSHSSLEALLWINDLIELNEPLSVWECVGTLHIDDQRLVVKKLSMLKGEGAVNVTLPTLKEWVWTDISTWVLLEIIEALSGQRVVKSQFVIEYIIKHLNDPTTDISIDGYFDECPGRAYTNSNGEICRHKVPRFIKWCEGRKLPPRTDEDGRLAPDAWLCGNQKCALIAIADRPHNEYRKYTMWDILQIYGVRYSIDNYQKLMGTLNRIRQLMERIKCRECGHIMHPARQSNYAFYRVNRFRCQNEKCASKDEVYLSHCINGYCSNIVDSRDSARCRPVNHSQESCGWYVCDYCMSCCTSEKLKNRRDIMLRTNQTYSCHLEGHKDRKEMCCPKCGTVLKSAEPQNIAKWFERHAANSQYVKKQGVRQDGGKWYLVCSTGFTENEHLRAFLQQAQFCGYGVPDIEDENRNLYLVGEPRPGSKPLMFKCPNCDYELPLSSLVGERDYQRLTALRYHDLIAELVPQERRARA